VRKCGAKKRLDGAIVLCKQLRPVWRREGRSGGQGEGAMGGRRRAPTGRIHLFVKMNDEHNLQKGGKKKKGES